MAKPDKPLLSLGARGTIGDTLTYQKRGREHIVRQKPVPRDPYSLNQAYQRWDYRDYAYLWTLLSNSEKQVYRTKASRYHITGFSQFMREQLKTLPDIALRWHLDERSGATAYDSSRNTNHGTIFGASPVPGIINGAYSFDGINDTIITPDHPSIQLPTTYTIEAFIEASPPTTTATLLHKGAVGAAPFNYLWLAYAAGHVLFRVWGADNITWWSITFGNVLDGTQHHLASTFNTTIMKTFADGAFVAQVATGQEAHTAPGHPIRLSHRWAAWFPGIVDEFAIHNRELDITEIKRHSERRYPS